MLRESILKEDFNYICYHSCVDFQQFENKTIFITGATGLIGSTLTRALLFYGEQAEHAPKVIAAVRNLEKAQAMYQDVRSENLSFYVADITAPVDIEDEIDYIIHAASQTSSKAFVNAPIETIRVALDGTVNMLELARKKKVSGFVYLSSMEVYGAPQTDEKISEEHGTDLNTMHVRTSYPEAKRMCESLCSAFYAEHQVPIKVARLTQTFGPGVSYQDGRVFAEFARCAMEERDIILHTKGETRRNYLYTGDAATAILLLLYKGKSGAAYNIANESTYCSIYEMAQLVAKQCADSKIDVLIQETDGSQFGYAPVLRMNLDTTKIRNLGWKPAYSLDAMYNRMIDGMRRGNE